MPADAPPESALASVTATSKSTKPGEFGASEPWTSWYAAPSSLSSWFAPLTPCAISTRAVFTNSASSIGVLPPADYGMPPLSAGACPGFTPARYAGACGPERRRPDGDSLRVLVCRVPWPATAPAAELLPKWELRPATGDRDIDRDRPMRTTRHFRSSSGPGSCAKSLDSADGVSSRRSAERPQRDSKRQTHPIHLRPMRTNLGKPTTWTSRSRRWARLSGMVTREMGTERHTSPEPLREAQRDGA